MEMTDTSFWTRTATQIPQTARLLPFETALALFFALLSSWTLFEHGEDYLPTFCAQGLVWAALSLVASFAVTLLWRLRAVDDGSRLWVTGAGLVFMGIFVFALMDFELETTSWRLLTVGAALICALPLTAAAARRAGAGQASVWRMTLCCAFRCVSSLAYVGAVMVAAVLALAALEGLFDVEWYRVLPYLGIWLGAVFAPLATARMSLRDLDHPSPVDTVTDKKLDSLLRYLVVPALLSYVAIIYLYTGKVVFTDEVPRNLLSPLALGACAVGLATMFVGEQFTRRLPKFRTSRWVRRLPWLLLGALPLAAWAIWERIAQHGWTEFRYLRMLLVVGLVASFVWACVQRVRDGRVAAHTAPAVFALLFALASFGPWSISYVSEASQLSRLRQEFEQAGVSASPKVSAASLESASIYFESLRSIRSRLEYLDRHHGKEAADGLFDNPKRARAEVSSWDLIKY